MCTSVGIFFSLIYIYFFIIFHRISGSIAALGGLVGACVDGPLLLLVSQKIVILLWLPVVVLLWLILAFSSTVWVILTARFLQGVCAVFLMNSSMMYITEIASKDVRGRLLGAYTVAKEVGYLAVYVLGSLSIHWRVIGLVCGCMCILPFPCLLFFPHSPYWLITQGRMRDAGKSFIFFRGHHFKPDLKLERIISNSDDVSKNRINYWQKAQMLFKSFVARKFYLLAFFSLLTTLCGVHVMNTYSVLIFQATKISFNPYISATMLAAVRVVGSSVSIGIIDNLGRRPLLIASYALSFVCLACFGGYFYILHLGYDRYMDWLPLPVSMLFTFFSSTATPVVNILQGELLPTSYRAVGISVLRFVCNLGMFSSLVAYPYMIDSLGEHWTFWIFSGACVAVALTVTVAFPETRGRSLEEISRIKWTRFF